jgi:hypothetical protein
LEGVTTKIMFTCEYGKIKCDAAYIRENKGFSKGW